MKFHQPYDSERGLAEALDLDRLMSDTRWQQLIEVLPDGIILVDRAGLVRYLNSSAETATELLRGEIVGRSLDELINRSRADIAFLRDAFDGGAKMLRNAFQSVERDGFSMSTRSIRDWSGNLTCFVIMIRNSVMNAPLADAASPGRPTDSISGELSGDQAIVLGSQHSTLVERGLRTLKLGSRLLLLGESGVGKTEFARLLHRQHFGATRPFVRVNCGSIPESLFESEMFGYERGSFTGALSKGKRGLVEAADSGTLFLDEVGEIPIGSQAKMLQFLEEGGVQRVGATQIRRLRLQIIAATNRDLRRMVADGTFRADLYYRLNVVTLSLPPLRECGDIIDLLIDKFLLGLNRRRSPHLQLEKACRQRIKSHAFPGNIRELQNIIEHLSIVTEGLAKEKDVVQALQHVMGLGESAALPEKTPELIDGESLSMAVKRFESKLVQRAIERAGSKRKAAELLGVDIATVVRKSRNQS